MKPLETVVVDTGPDPQYAVVWLHGLGADGYDFEPVVPLLRGSGEAGVRFIFPHAPVQPVTINGGMRMRAWYDIRGLDLKDRVDAEGIRESAAQVEALLVAEEARGVPASRIVLAGFSQGGAVALYLALRFDRRLAGIIALSTYLPLADELTEYRHEANAETPIFMAHGTGDPVVPVALGEASARRLEALGQPLSWQTYPIPHAVSPEELADVRSFLATRLGD